MGRETSESQKPESAAKDERVSYDVGKTFELQLPEHTGLRQLLARASEAYLEFSSKYPSLFTDLSQLQKLLKLLPNVAPFGPNSRAGTYDDIPLMYTEATNCLRRLQKCLEIDRFPTEETVLPRDLRWFFLKLFNMVSSLLTYLFVPRNFDSAYDRRNHEAYVVSLWNDLAIVLATVNFKSSKIILSCMYLKVNVWDWAAVYQIDIPLQLQQHGFPVRLFLPGAGHDTEA